MDANRNRNRLNHSGNVAAKIQAYQEVSNSGHGRSSLLLPQRRPTAAYAAKEDNTATHELQRDLSVASPASWFSKREAERTRAAQKYSDGMSRRRSHASFEEKEVCLEPQTASSTDFHDRTGSPQTRRQPSAHETVQRFSSDEKIDSVAELLTARSRLRSTNERNYSTDQKNVAPQFTLSDLETILDNAIGQQARGSTVSNISIEPLCLLPRRGRIETDHQPQGKQDQGHRSITDDVRLDEEQISPRQSVSGNFAQPPNPQQPYLDLFSMERGTQLEFELGSTTTTASISPSKMVRRGSMFQRYNSRTQRICSNEADKVQADGDSSMVVSSTPFRTPVKERKALFEDKPLTAQYSRPRTSSASNTPLRRAEWSQYQRSTERNANPFRKLVRNHRRCATLPIAGTSLIPLNLPLIVGQAGCDNSIVLADDDMQRPQLPSSSARNIPKSLEENTEFLDTNPAGVLQRYVQASEPDTGSQLDHGLFKEKRCSKWDLLQRNKTAKDLEQKETFTPKHTNLAITHEPRRISIVESRIQALMAASKQTVSKKPETRRSTMNTNVGRIKLSTITDGVSEHGVIEVETPPVLKTLIGKQAEVANPFLASTTTTMKSAGKPLNKSGLSREAVLDEKEPTSPIRSTRDIPSTPIRGRTQQIKQSMSPGFPYTMEQRFNLSPSRSRSRRSESAVFVSVEVRSSPERVNGKDEHEVIVRAGVDPNDISEESE